MIRFLLKYVSFYDHRCIAPGGTIRRANKPQMKKILFDLETVGYKRTHFGSLFTEREDDT